MITYIFEGGSCDAVLDDEKGFELTCIVANNVNLDNGQLPYKLMERVLRGKRHATRIMAMLEAENHEARSRVPGVSHWREPRYTLRLHICPVVDRKDFPVMDYLTLIYCLSTDALKLMLTHEDDAAKRAILQREIEARQ